MQLTDRRIYFMWEDVRRRGDIPLFEDAENAPELPPPIAPTDLELQRQRIGRYSFASMGAGSNIVFVSSLDPVLRNSVGCIDFTLMPEGHASQI
jgi:hypothetical protein